ncbi:MAG: hypothetical protein IT426_11885 [Pirellulales bacterium]|nr:hypothetical protein [Pirellulales bacterium]
MNLKQLLTKASRKENFTRLSDYLDFCVRFLEFVEEGLQAVIISQNEQHYCFYQFKRDGSFNITRPINSHLMYGAKNQTLLESRFLKTLKNAKDIGIDDEKNRAVIRNSIYTIQQSIGAVLDALPAGKSNTARKINGDLFERLIRLLISELGIDCTSGVVQLPVVVDGVEEFAMSYQHDLIIRLREEIKVIGSVKTSSKDRIDKIFIDKFLYNKLAEKAIPHIAVFLNDVQRKKTKRENQYGVNATFLPGHFKGYTIKLNPLDGVYYCDIRPNMETDQLLRKHIQTIDHLFCRDIWTMLQ